MHDLAEACKRTLLVVLVPLSLDECIRALCHRYRSAQHKLVKFFLGKEGMKEGTTHDLEIGSVL